MDGSDQRGGCWPGPGRRLRRGLAGAWAPAVAARGLRYRCPHCPPAAEPAHGAARCHPGHAGAAAAAPARPDQASWKQLPRLYPQVLDVARRSAAAGESWPAPWPHGMAEAERRSQASGHAELALADLARAACTWCRRGCRPAMHCCWTCAHHSRRRMAHATRHQPGARLAGPGRAGIPDPARQHRLARLEHMVLGGEQDPGLAQPAAGAVPAPAAGRLGAALDGHAGLGPGLCAGRGRAARPAAPARGPPPRRAVAAAGPGGTAQYAGRTGRRHGA